MQQYELTLILANDLGKDSMNTLLQDVSAFIQEKGGILEKQEIMGPQASGVLALIAFSMRKEEIENLQKKIRGETGVVRFMLMTAKKNRAPLPQMRTLSEKPYLKEPQEPTQKLSAEDIDKKLEEIFKSQ